MKLALASLILLGTAAPAMAQTASFYGDIGYTNIAIDGQDAGLSDDITLGSIMAHGGILFTPNFGAEGELAIGIQDEDIDFGGGVTGNVGLNYLVGAYGRAQVEVTPQLVLFARAGVVNAELEAEAAGVSVSDSETGAGYGAGGEFMFDAFNGIRLDYTRYDIEDLEADALTIAYKRKF